MTDTIRGFLYHLGILGHGEDKISFEKAKKYYLKVLDKNPNNTVVLHKIGSLIYRKNIKEAKKYYIKTLSIDPEYKYALNSLGVICEKEKNYQKAEEYYLRALRVDPKYKRCLYNLGKYYYGIYGKVLRVDPEYEKAREYYLKLKLKNVRRKLFPGDPVDHEQIQHELKQYINKTLDEKLSKWNYDFKNDTGIGWFIEKI
jgi:tetratricopeptide (TPR) repeat protein